MLTVTKSIQHVVEVGSHLVDNEGLVRSESKEQFDEDAGRLLALLVMDKYNDEFSPLIMASVTDKYCSRRLYESFIDGLNSLGIQLASETNETVEAVMDIQGTAEQGRKLGWKQEWCPFDGDAEEDWNRGFQGNKFRYVWWFIALLFIVAVVRHYYVFVD